MTPPKPSREQVEKWIWSGARDALRGHPPSSEEAADRSFTFFGWRTQNAVRIKGVRQALERAKTKNLVKAINPFRRLRRNQSAVNEGLIDATRGLLALVREMGAALDLMHAKLKDLEMQLAEQRPRSPVALARDDPPSECE